MDLESLPADWRAVLDAEFAAPYFARLCAYVAAERAAHAVFPPAEEVFTALVRTPRENVRAVILGQDPYHGDGQAHGLAFSVRPGVKPPPSLRNLFKELQADLDLPPPSSGSLEPWSEQGVLLLNTALTVRAHAPLSHRGRGWETFTDAVIDAVNAKEEPVVFLLWGGPAQRKAARIDRSRHIVLSAPHPSPLSAHRGFLGSRPFSRANDALRAARRPPIDWRLP